jgi:acetoin utilization protein AcuB
MSETVRDVMCREVVTIHCNATMQQAERLLLAADAGDLYVIDDEGRLLGVLPDYELLKLRLFEPAAPPDMQAVISRNPLAVAPETPLVEAACHLRAHVHPRLPVVDHGRLVGQIRRRDVLQRLSQVADEQAAQRCDGGRSSAAPPLAGPNFLRTPSKSVVAAPAG